MKSWNLTTVGMMVAIAGALVILTDGAEPWKAVTAWALWGVGLGLAIWGGRPKND